MIADQLTEPRPSGSGTLLDAGARLARSLTVAALLGGILSLCPAAEKNVEVTREVFLMGTRCTLTTFADNRQSGLEQIEKHLRILEEAEHQLSTWRADSVLSQLNRQPIGLPFRSPPFLCRLFGELLHWVSETGSAFDPAVGSLVRAWGLRETGHVPSPEALKAALEDSGLSHFSFDRSHCGIVRTGAASIDCGAFGKGEALDRLLHYASRHAASPWLVDLGGQIAVYGHPPDSSYWTVDLAHPGDRHIPVLSLKLRCGSLSTSAGSERDLKFRDQRVGHILDPRTGGPASFRGSVTVWHERGLIADILSTALYVMGPQEGKAWAEARNVAACFFVLPVAESSGQERFETIATEAFALRFFQSGFQYRNR